MQRGFDRVTVADSLITNNFFRGFLFHDINVNGAPNVVN